MMLGHQSAGRCGSSSGGEGYDLYTAMIQSLLFLADCRNNVGDWVPPLGFDVSPRKYQHGLFRSTT